MTLKQLLVAMRAAGPKPSESSVNKLLFPLKQLKMIDNKQDESPPGYGLFNRDYTEVVQPVVQPII